MGEVGERGGGGPEEKEEQEAEEEVGERRCSGGVIVGTPILNTLSASLLSSRSFFSFFSNGGVRGSFCSYE